MNKGVLCISIDTELLWGRKDLNYAPFVKKVRKERIIIKKLLRLFSKYNVPVTWAVVGKMREKGHLLWHGPDIVELIKKAKIHEIASHSHSHEIFDTIDAETAEREIGSFKAKTFIFPRNKVAYLHLLKKHGFIAFRGADKTSCELLLPRIPPVYSPIRTQELINIPGSMYFVSARGIRRFIPPGLRYIKARLGIDKAIKQKRVFHLWFHPIDLADQTTSLLKELEKILNYARSKAARQELEIKTLRRIALEYSL